MTIDLDRLGLRKGTRALDVGCGLGRHAFAIARSGAWVVALDLGADELRHVRAVVTAMLSSGELAADSAVPVALRGDILTLPFPDETFDVVVASEVLEHIPDDENAIAELARVLRRGGTLAVTVPRWGPECLNWLLSKEYHSVPGGHVRIYRRSELRRRLRSCGLVPKGAHYAHGLHSPYWWLRCLVGPSNEENRAVAAYRRFLEWDIVHGPRITRALDRLLNPLIGKSLVIYLTKDPVDRVAVEV